jgi:hypothetical protein
MTIYIVLLACFLPVAAQAQQPLDFSAVEVALWPEYDRPSVLVIYRITLSPQASLPVEVRLRIPAYAGPPNAVASRTPDGSLYNLLYEQENLGEWSELVFQATTPELQIEYYDTKLVKEGQERHFEYTWPGDYAVNAFQIQVQQPRNAGQMLISPSLGSGAVGEDGMIYFTSDIGPLTEGQSFSISVDYQKPDDELSAAGVPVQASGPLDDSASGRWTLNSALPYILGIFGLALIGGGAYWYWQSGQEKSAPKRKRGTRRKSSQVDDRPVANEGSHIYCHQCGKRAAAGDRFCRSCGTQLRRE